MQIRKNERMTKEAKRIAEHINNFTHEPEAVTLKQEDYLALEKAAQVCGRLFVTGIYTVQQES